MSGAPTLRIEEISLGERGIEYVLEWLRLGRDLCEYLLELPIVSGEIFAPVPAGIRLEDALQLNRGGILRDFKIESWLTTHLQENFQTTEPLSLFFQDFWLKPDDVKQLIPPAVEFYSDSKVYYPVPRLRFDPISISRALYARGSIEMFGVLATVNVPDRLRVDDEYIRNVAQKTEEIYIGAYDQEGLVVWRRKL